MKRIAIVINSLKKGGAEKQAVMLACTLVERAEVTFVVIRAEEGMEDMLVNPLLEAGVTLVVLDRMSGRGVRGLCSVLRHKRYDVMFCYLTYANLTGAVAGRLCGVRQIWQGLRNAYIPSAKIPAEWVANRLSTGAILNNHAGVDFFRCHGIRNIKVIANGYGEVLHPRRRQSGEKVRVVTAARFVTQKDYGTALEAFKLVAETVRELTYRIIGHGEQESMIRAMISRLGLEGRVEMFVNPTDVKSLVDECDIYLSTSLWEGTSNSIMEAMDMSLPVVATDVGDNGRLVEDGVTGYVAAAGDVDMIAARVKELALSQELRNEMGESGNLRLRKSYGADVFAAAYYALIDGASSVGTDDEQD